MVRQKMREGIQEEEQKIEWEKNRVTQVLPNGVMFRPTRIPQIC